MEKRLAGRVAIVTGAGRGIGQGIAETFARHGATVACLDLHEERVNRVVSDITAQGGQARGYAVNVADRTAVHNVVADVKQAFGNLDILVNNAAWVRYQPLESVDQETVDRMFDVGVKAMIWTTQAAAPLLCASGRGAVINISSSAAIRATPDSAAYCAVKGAVAGLTRQLALDLGQHNVHVNAIAPGFVQTEAARRNVPREAVDRRLATTPLGRLSEVDDIADLALFLASSESRFVNGEVILADGGRAMAAL